MFDSKTQKIFSPPKIYTDFDKKFIPNLERRNDAMELVQQNHTEVQNYVDQINDKTIEAIEMEEQRLHQRYFHLLNQLEKTKLQIIKLEEKLKQQNDLDNHPQIKQIISELSKVDQYRIALMSKTQQLTNQLQLNSFTIKELKQKVIQKRLEIRDCVRECWSVQQQIINTEKSSNSTARTQRMNYQSLDISSNRSNINLFITGQEQKNIKKLSLSQLPPIQLKKQSKTKLIKVLQKASFVGQQQPVNDIIEIYKQINILRKKILESKQTIQKKQNQYFCKRNLLVDCANISLKNFKNKQKKTNHDGYANSIYFDFSTSMNLSINDSSNKERKIQNILYDTLQQIMINTIDTQQKSDPKTNPDQLIKKAISQEQFQQFSPEQILGLMALQPKLFQEIINIFEWKHKQLGLLTMKLKTQSNDF